MKTPEELSALKSAYESLTVKLSELEPEELEQVTGGIFIGKRPGKCEEDGTHGPISR